MSFNHQKAFTLLKKQHEQEWVLLLSAGISEARIDELFEADMRQMKRDRAFYVHLDLYIEPADEIFADESGLDGRLHWLDEIENPALAAALETLLPDELEIIDLHINEQLPLPYVAAFLDKPCEQVKSRYHRAIKKLKKHF